MEKKRFMTADAWYYGLLKCYANENRNHQTDAENLLWQYLSNNPWGVHFRRQHIIGCYIADFICIKNKLIVEIDGGYHAQEEQKLKDYLRTQDLEKMGYTVIRFTNNQLYSNMSNVLDDIFNHIIQNIQKLIIT